MTPPKPLSAFIKPDYEEIKSCLESNPSYRYSTLWEKYQKGDAGMSLEEKRLLYYGYVFHEHYSPYDLTSIPEEMKAKKNSTRKDRKAYISILNDALHIEPFHCRYLYWQSVAYTALGKSEESQRNINKIQCIMDALSSTGDGLSKETAIHVITVSQEYDYLFWNHLSMHSQFLIDEGYDVLQVVSNEGNDEDMNLLGNENSLNELWFNIQQLWKHKG